MKIRLTFKDPDGVYDSLSEYVDTMASELMKSGAYDSDQRGDAEYDARKGLSAAISPWVSHGEYVTIEIDTETGSATVVARK